MDQRTIGVFLVGPGVLAVVAGILAMTGAPGWFGRLPGDVRIESGRTRIYSPIMSMLLVSMLPAW
ncbi:MAG TPA: DUF2905 domain-containing protein [Longimicrobium sp.]|nr:DUF2905 domain-containing protein [Longimicrobium sp.]